MSFPHIDKNSKRIHVPSFLLDHQHDLLSRVRESVIGDFKKFITVFGKRNLVYVDYVASGRSLSFIEDYLSLAVLPYYANTHTITSLVGLQTLNLREEAREVIKSCVNASDQDALIFVGSGATGAVNKLVRILQNSRWGKQASTFVDYGSNVGCTVCKQKFVSEGSYIKHLETSCRRDEGLGEESKNNKPVVFVSVLEHHSNLLP